MKKLAVLFACFIGVAQAIPPAVPAMSVRPVVSVPVRTVTPAPVRTTPTIPTINPAMYYIVTMSGAVVEYESREECMGESNEEAVCMSGEELTEQ